MRRSFWVTLIVSIAAAFVFVTGRYTSRRATGAQARSAPIPTAVGAGRPVPRLALDRPRESSAALAGFTHDLPRSRFDVGTGARQVHEHGWDKVVGRQGVFARRRANGYALGVPNADALARSRGPLTRSAEAHNDRVLGYFKAAGLPGDQVELVRPSAWMGGAGRKGDPASGEQFEAFSSVVQRRISGIPVPDSSAWARFNQDDVAVSEGVFWPAVPQAVLDQAHRLQALLADPVARAAYQARLPTTEKNGRVTIRHSGSGVDDEPRFWAAYDVTERVGPGVSVVRHFDAEGVEFRLPQEMTDGAP